MKRKISLALLLLILGLLIVSLFPIPAFAAGTSVEDAAVTYGTSYSPNGAHHTFYCEENGYYYVFVTDAGGLKYHYTNEPQGASGWAEGTVTTHCTKVYHAEDYYDGHFYTIWEYGSGNDYFQQGTPNVDGTITWSAEFNTGWAATDNLDIAVSTTEYPFMVFYSSYHLYCVRSARTVDEILSLGWLAAETKDLLDGATVSDGGVSVHRLTGGKMAVVMGPGSTADLTVRRYAGGWDSLIVSGTDADVSGYYVSAAAHSDYVEICYNIKSGADGDLYYVRYDGAANSFGAFTKLHDLASHPTWGVGGITYATDTGQIFIFYYYDSTHIYLDWYEPSEATWYTTSEVVYDAGGIAIPQYAPDAIFPTDFAHAGFSYLTSTNTAVKWFCIGGQIHVDTLEATNVTETSATLNGEIVTISWGTPNERGFYWDTTPSLGNTTGTLQLWNATGSFGVGTWDHVITNLTEGESYYCIAYATNAETAWGEWIEVVAGGTGGWAVLTLEPDPIGDFEATFRGNITEVAGTYATITGFQWGITATPTWDWNDTGNFTVGVYEYEATLEADSIYYVRAYAGNATVVDYGQWIGFITDQPSYQSDEGIGEDDGLTPPLPAEPGGWIRPPKDWGSFMGIPWTFVLYLFLIFLVVSVGLAITKYTRSLAVLFIVLGFIIGVFSFWPRGGYLDWWVLFPYVLVGWALLHRQSEYPINE